MTELIELIVDTWSREQLIKCATGVMFAGLDNSFVAELEGYCYELLDGDLS